MKPFFSIIIVNYNGDKYLEDAILSIISQSYKNYELLVVDGKSNDASISIIEKYSDYIKWWVSESDSGQSNAFNKAFKMASGKYFFWINSDDLLLKNSLRTIRYHIYKNKNYEWFSGNTIFIDKDGSIKKCANGFNWSDFFFTNLRITVYGPTSIFSRKIFQESKGFDESLKFSMDTDLWHSFKSLGYKYKKINAYLWGFRLHEESKTSHLFFGPPSQDFILEQNRIDIKHKIKIMNYKKYLLYIFKILTGLYLKSFLDTFRFKGKNINSI